MKKASKTLVNLAALSAPLAQYASSVSPYVVAVTALICAGAGWILSAFSSEADTGRVLPVIRAAWIPVLIASLGKSSAYVWPQFEYSRLIPILLVFLGAWSASHGSESVSRASQAIAKLLLLLHGALLLSGIGEIRAENLMQVSLSFSPALLTVLLLPGVLDSKPEKKQWYAVSAFGLLLSIVTVGVLSQRTAESQQSAYYYLSRSLSLFAVADRFESLIACAMSLGYFALFSQLLALLPQKRGVLATCTAFSVLLILTDVIPAGWPVAAVTFILFYAAPCLSTAAKKKFGKF